MAGQTLTFTPSVSSLTVSVPIINDNITEGEQFFIGNLSNPQGPVTLDPEVATVTIVDDDGKSYVQAVNYIL